MVFISFLPISFIKVNDSWLFASYSGFIGFILKNNIVLSKNYVLSISIILNLILIFHIFGILTIRNIKKLFKILRKKNIDNNLYQHTQHEFVSDKYDDNHHDDYEDDIIKDDFIDDQLLDNEYFEKPEKEKPEKVHEDKLKKIKSFLKKEKKTQIKKPNKYIIPPLDFLSSKKEVIKQHEQNFHKGQMLEKVLADFKIEGKIIEISVGPVVTLYELQPAAGIKSATVISLATDVARTMSAISARISIIPGRNALGIELPNKQREIVLLRELLEAEEYKDPGIELPVALGKSINGTPIVVDLTKMPHLLVAGTTGSGKSVAINAMILSLIYRLSPDECKLILIDPKMLELSVYDDIPHLLSPVVIDPKKAVVALKWVVKEMEKRYKLMAKLSVRNIDGYNKKAEEYITKGKTFEYEEMIGIDPVTGERLKESVSVELKKMPFIVVVVDEMADLMLVAGKEIEISIQRLAQMARASGIHIIMATQRPSVDVITGVIKANFPTRISFAVTSKIDSRTILGEQGAEQLLGRGDMLYMSAGRCPIRIHGPFVSDTEVEDVVNYLKQCGEPEYDDDITIDEQIDDPMDSISTEDNIDSLYKQAINIIRRDNKVSISYIQRKLSIGYNKAATIVEKMEADGVVSPPNHSGKRNILGN
jgi:S-DNA-T family DNA segregation ATPase FtsK/SpoIIIE